jgi:hypothetical protein
MLEELSRAAERFLEEASKYGEVSLIFLLSCIWNFFRLLENPFIPMVDETRKPIALLLFSVEKKYTYRFRFVIGTTCDSI